MSVRLEELLRELSTLSCIHVVAGEKGLQREVAWVNTIENQETIHLLHRSELVFSTGVETNQQSDALLSLVQKTCEAGAAGSILSLGPYIRHLPQTVIDYSNLHDYPLLTAPGEMRLSDITYSICDYIINNRERNAEIKMLLFDLLSYSENQEEIIKKLDSSGYNQDFSYGALIVERANTGKTEAAASLQTIHNQLMYSFYRCFRFEISERFVYIIVQKNPKSKQRFKSIYEAVKDLNQTLQKDKIRIGIGNFYSNLRLLNQSYREAIVASNALIADRRLTGGLKEFNRSGLYKVLVQLNDNPTLLKFSHETLRPLEEYDRINNTQYMNFLRVYLNNDANIAKTSQELFIHRNTTMYKINKIERILGHSISPLKAKSELIISLIIKDYL